MSQDPLSDLPQVLSREYFQIVHGAQSVEQQKLALEVWLASGYSTRCTQCRQQGHLDWSMDYPEFRCAIHTAAKEAGV